MGKKAFQINIDKGTLKNLGKNVVGAAGYAMGGLPGLAASTVVNDKLFGSKGGGGGGGGGQQPESIESISKRYAEEQEKQRLKSAEVGGQLTEQLRQQAMGEGPLAGAQLKQAQTRNLAQTLAAAQGAGASPLAMRQMLQQRGQQGQELAQLGIQERMGAQQTLGQQLATQAATGRADIMAGFDISKTPAVMAQERALQAASIQAQKDAALNQQQSGLLGGVIGAGASLLPLAFSDENAKMPPNESDEKSKESDEEKKSKARRKAFAKAGASIAKGMSPGEGIAALGASLADVLASRKSATPTVAPTPIVAPTPAMAMQPFSGARFASPDIMSDIEQKVAERNKGKDESKFPSASKEVNEMMDKLEPKKYRYKNPNAPGAAEGNRYGIMAQDLEKSSLGKTLVKQTQQGKMVDTVQGFGAVLAAQAELNRRLKKLEKKGK